MTFKYFSGFSLKDEKDLFNEYIIENDFTVSGFSYGAIKAFEYALNSDIRIDLLQLFSPAFFQCQDKRFKKAQMMFFKKDADTYCENFLENIAFPSKFDMNEYFEKGNIKELDELLNYNWDEEKLQKLLDKGTKIEVYLGDEDKIIDSYEAASFFRKFSTVYFMKNKGHMLL